MGDAVGDALAKFWFSGGPCRLVGVHFSMHLLIVVSSVLILVLSVIVQSKHSRGTITMYRNRSELYFRFAHKQCKEKA